jgi:hypothetical protein
MGHSVAVQPERAELSRSGWRYYDSGEPVTDTPGETEHPKPRNRCTIPATCTTHGGAKGFTNLLVSKRDGDIELNPMRRERA